VKCNGSIAWGGAIFWFGFSLAFWEFFRDERRTSTMFLLFLLAATGAAIAIVGVWKARQSGL
jgi:membrane protein DedA with SNARE-associated domain